MYTTYKSPSEKIPLVMDFSTVIPAGQSLQNASDVKVFTASGENVSGDLIHFQQIVSPYVKCTLKNGESPNDYKVVFTAKTELYTFEEKVILKVRLL